MASVRFIETAHGDADRIAEIVAVTNAVIDGRPEVAVTDVARAQRVAAVAAALRAAEDEGSEGADAP